MDTNFISMKTLGKKKKNIEKKKENAWILDSKARP